MITREEIRQRIIGRNDLLDEVCAGSMDQMINVCHVSINQLDMDVDEAIQKYGYSLNVLDPDKCNGACYNGMSRYAFDLRNENTRQ